MILFLAPESRERRSNPLQLMELYSLLKKKKKRKHEKEKQTNKKIPTKLPRKKIALGTWSKTPTVLDRKTLTSHVFRLEPWSVFKTDLSLNTFLCCALCFLWLKNFCAKFPLPVWASSPSICGEPSKLPASRNGQPWEAGSCFDFTVRYSQI